MPGRFPLAPHGIPRLATLARDDNLHVSLGMTDRGCAHRDNNRGFCGYALQR